VEGRDPLLWEDDDLSRIRDLHTRTFDDKKVGNAKHARA
jgi:hypothetical protein